MKPFSFALLLSLVVALGGCIFSPDKGGGKKIEPPVYEPNRFPEAVLRNLVKAYANKDSTVYKTLFDENYEGTSIDQFDTTPELLNLRLADEAKHISGLARSTVTSITVQLYPNLVAYNDAGDPAGWVTIQDPFASFLIYDLQDVWHIVPPIQGTNRATFKFIPSATSPADTTWKIIRFNETRS